MSINRNKVLKAAQKQIRKRNWDKALREYRKLVDDDPSDMRSLLKCGDLHVKLDEIDQALASYKAVADTYAQQDMYEKAIAVYKQAKRLDDDDVAIHHAIAECHYRLGRLKDAVRTFHKVQIMYKERGHHDQQRQILEHMVHIDPEDVGLRIQLAERYLKDDFADLALQSFTYSASVLEQEGRLDELIQILERIIFLSPQRLDLRKKVVQLYLDRQDNQAALKHLQVCFRESPSDIFTLEMLAQTFERLDKTDKAVMVIEELIPLYEAAGRDADADNLYRRLLRLDPQNELALQATGQDSGPDSGVLAGRADTGPMASRQATPPPTGDVLDGVEFLDDDVEFLDDDVEFLDDDLVAESAPAARSAAPPPPDAQRPPQASPATSAPPAMPPQPPPVDAPDMTEEIEFLDDQTLDDVDSIAEIESLDDVESIAEIEPIEAIEAIEPIDETAEQIQQILSECDVFIKYGLYDKASEVIQKALDLDSQSLRAHEVLLQLQETTGDRPGQVQTLLNLANIVADRPEEARDYLQQAHDIAPEPLAVIVKAKSLGIDLERPAGPPAAAPPSTDRPATDAAGAIPPEPDTLHLSAEEMTPLDDDEDDTFEGEAPDAISDPFDEALAGLDDALDALGQSEPSPPSAQSLAEPTDDSAELIDELDDFGDFDFDSQVDDLAFDTDSEVVDDMELQFGDADEIVDMNLSSDDDFDDADLAALDDDSQGDNASGPGVNSLFEGVEADELFGDLFGDMGDNLGDGAALSGDDPMGEMAEIDFFIQQGLTEEASEALQVFESDNPSHPGISTRREQIHDLRAGAGAGPDEHAFGARSLSQKFNPNASLEESTGEDSANFGNLVNSNLELGVAYRDMGLLNEAIDEFRQAAEDPEATVSAHYNIALCEIDLGNLGQARSTFQQILTFDDLGDDVRQKVENKLAELEAQAS